MKPFRVFLEDDQHAWLRQFSFDSHMAMGEHVRKALSYYRNTAECIKCEGTGRLPVNQEWKSKFRPCDKCRETGRVGKGP